MIFAAQGEVVGWVEALTSIVSSIAWPVVVIVAFFVFRKSLGGLLTRLTSYEGAGQKLTFGAEVEKAERGVAGKIENSVTSEGTADGRDSKARLSSSDMITSTGDDVEWGQLAELAKVSGSAAVIEAWKFTETALRGLAARVQAKRGGDAETFRYKSPVKILRDLRAQSVPGIEGIAGAVNDLSRLRNEAAHSDIKISENEALGYGDFALSVARRIDQMER